MPDLLVSGKTRLKLLLKFFLAPGMRGHLRGLAEEYGESTNAIRLMENVIGKLGNVTQAYLTGDMAVGRGR